MLSRVARAAPAVQRMAAVATVRAASIAAARTQLARSLPIIVQACRGFAADPLAGRNLNNIEKIVDTIAALPPRNNSWVITAAGPDRPGIVHDLTRLLKDSGANVEESRMAVLGNDFAILLRITTPDGHSVESIKSLVEKEFGEFAVGVRSTQSQSPTFQNPVRILSVQVEGPDQPGIVQTLTKIFVDLKGSVRDLDTDCSNAPFAGYKIFQLKCVVAFPIDTDFDAFETALHQFEDNYGFDVQVHEGMQRDLDEEMEDQEDEEAEDEPEEADYDEPEPPRRAAPAPARRGVSPPPPPQASRTAPPPPQRAAAGQPQRPAAAQPAARGPTAPPRAAGRGPATPPTRR